MGCSGGPSSASWVSSGCVRCFLACRPTTFNSPKHCHCNILYDCVLQDSMQDNQQLLQPVQHRPASATASLQGTSAAGDSLTTFVSAGLLICTPFAAIILVLALLPAAAAAPGSISASARPLGFSRVGGFRKPPPAAARPAFFAGFGWLPLPFASALAAAPTSAGGIADCEAFLEGDGETVPFAAAAAAGAACFAGDEDSPARAFLPGDTVSLRCRPTPSLAPLFWPSALWLPPLCAALGRFLPAPSGLLAGWLPLAWLPCSGARLPELLWLRLPVARFLGLTGPLGDVGGVAGRCMQVVNA
jgi:hypothetical protein